ncbi:hypothetical protein GFPCMMHI_02533 [Ensifer adhaerens]|nr:hypothetical protein [Ensifer adhaerens]
MFPKLGAERRPLLAMLPDYSTDFAYEALVLGQFAGLFYFCRKEAQG